VPSDKIAATEESYRSDPDAARGAPTVTGRLSEGKAQLTAGNHVWHADLPPALGGTGTAPTPTQLLLGALAGCAVAFIHDTLAPQLDIPIDDISATARCRTDARGLLGMEGAPPDLMDLELEITVDSPASADQVAALEKVWLERCPIYLAIAKPNGVSVRLARGPGKGEPSSSS
jgi:uncharacterized OsmC-like protein